MVVGLCIALAIAILAGLGRIVFTLVVATGRLTARIISPVFFLVFGLILVAKFLFKFLLPVLIVVGIGVLLKNIFLDKQH